MFDFQIVDNHIVGTIGENSFSVTYDQKLYESLQAFEEKLENTSGRDEYVAVLEEISGLLEGVKEEETSTTESKYIRKNQKTGLFYLVWNDTISDVPLPNALAERILESQSKGVDYMPLIKMWVRFLRNPVLRKPGKGMRFAERFFNFVNLKYVHPKLKKELMDKGFSEEVATEKATMYQMKITKEGLLNGYKVSSEILHKFDSETGDMVDRYKRTFNVDTGEIESDGLPEFVEERLFEPAVMGDRGDAFSCEGPNGFKNPGHFIRVGCVHSLSSWNMVDTDDYRSCVPGLHVGGLKYISGYSGEIHNVFIDPMHVGAVPDDGDGAIRCKQYFVHSSLAGINGAIYHSSQYAKITDAEFDKMVEEAVKVTAESVQQLMDTENALSSLK
jgi:hypothetical protein